LRKLAKKITISHLMPNIVHNVQLLAAAPHLMSAHKKVYTKPVHFILVSVLGVDGSAVHAIHDVVDGEEVVSTSTQHPSGNVEVGHLLFGHWLGLKVNLEDVGVIVIKLISNTSSKLLPRGLHHMLPSHPFQRAKTSFILKEYSCGVELAYHFLGVVVREGHQRCQSLFFTNLKSFSKILEVGVELIHADGVLGTTVEFLGPIDFVVDPFLIDMIEEGIGALTGIPW
jgi:hypothetical protein